MVRQSRTFLTALGLALVTIFMIIGNIDKAVQDISDADLKTQMKANYCLKESKDVGAKPVEDTSDAQIKAQMSAYYCLNDSYFEAQRRVYNTRVGHTLLLPGYYPLPTVGFYKQLTLTLSLTLKGVAL